MWELLHPDMTPDHLGFLPHILDSFDPRPTAEQIEDKYAHGGGWRPYGQGAWALDDDRTLHFPNDQALKPIARTFIREEQVYLYDHAVVAVVQPDGSFDVVRLD